MFKSEYELSHEDKDLTIRQANQFGLIELNSITGNTNVLIRVEEMDGLIMMLLEAKMKEEKIGNE